MEIRQYHPSEQVDVAVDLGVLPPPLPGICFVEDFADDPPMPPPQLIHGVLHQGCKLVLGATSKSNKTWALLDLAISVASGQEWWGQPTTKAKALFINFELQPWAICQRLQSLLGHRPECAGAMANLALWNLRGRNADLSLLRPQLEEQLDRHQFGLICFDPIFKVLGDRNENDNGQIADLMNELEALAQRTRAAIAISHHFAKGDASSKHPIDRMSGAGAWARDPDALVLLTPHEEPEHFVVTSVLRNLPQLPEFVVAWDYPMLRRAPQADPQSLRRPQSGNKVCSDHEFIERYIIDEPLNRKTIVAMGVNDGISAATMDRFLRRLTSAGVICCSQGTYWRKTE